MATNTVNGKRYIGATSRSFEKRKKRHLDRWKIDRGCPRFYDAIHKYGPQAFVWKVLKKFKNAACAFTFETIAIALIKPEYNVTSGGYRGKGFVPKNKKKVLCLEDGKIFDSMASAAKFYRSESASISEVCNGTRKTAVGRHFVLFTRGLNDKEREALIKEKNSIDAKNRRRRGEAGLKVKYADLSGGRDRLGRKATGPMRISRRVICLDTGETFPSANDAAKKNEIAVSSLIELCLGKNGRKTVGGLRFKYLDERK